MSLAPARKVRRLLSRVVNGVRRRIERRGQRVSVVVTARESHTPFLAECLQSLSNQSWPHLQILVVPFDGGQRSVARSIQSLVEKDRRIALVEGAEARTVGAARNAGAKRARGDFLVFVGGGDLVPPHAIGRLLHQPARDRV